MIYMTRVTNLVLRIRGFQQDIFLLVMDESIQINIIINEYK